MKVLTRTHHKMIRDFMTFRSRNEDVLREREKLLQNWIFCEEALAHRSPTFEAEFALDEKTALSMYDCLVPVLREHRRFKIMPDTSMTVEDFKSQLKVIQLRREEDSERVPRLIEENANLTAQNKQLLDELEIVNWYREVIDGGVNSREVLSDYVDLKKKYQVLQKQTSRTIK